MHEPTPSRPASPSSSSDSASEEAPLAPAVDYRAFRLIADWSAGMADETVVFHYGPGGELGAGAAGVGEPQLRVPARTLAKEDRVASLVLRTDDGHELELATRSDAAFWSEAAVEKFVVPYYASLGAGRADTVLAQLLGAWTRHADDGVQVMALTHFAHPETPGATDVAHTLAVVYLAAPGAAPRRATLAAFLGEHAPCALQREIPLLNPAPPTPREMPLPRSAPRVEGYDPSYLPLRVMAEWSSSWRGTPVYFVFDTTLPQDPDDPYVRFYPTHTPPADPAGKVVIPTYTEPLVPGRPRPAAMEILPAVSGALTYDLAPGADAVFWSTGAVEKFLLPYYAGVYGGRALYELTRLYDAWWHNRPGAGPGPEGVLETEVEPDTVVYAMIHLPNSDWAARSEAARPEETTHSVLDITGVLFAERTRPEQARVLTLREYLRQYRR